MLDEIPKCRSAMLNELGRQTNVSEQEMWSAMLDSKLLVRYCSSCGTDGNLAFCVFPVHSVE